MVRSAFKCDPCSYWWQVCRSQFSWNECIWKFLIRIIRTLTYLREGNKLMDVLFLNWLSGGQHFFWCHSTDCPQLSCAWCELNVAPLVSSDLLEYCFQFLSLWWTGARILQHWYLKPSLLQAQSEIESRSQFFV